MGKAMCIREQEIFVFRKMLHETPVSESLFNKVAGHKNAASKDSLYMLQNVIKSYNNSKRRM